MNERKEVSRILESLHEHIEEQKRFLDDENKKLLEKGKANYQEVLTNKRLGLPENENLFFNLKRKYWRNLNVKSVLMKFILGFVELGGYLSYCFRKIKNIIRQIRYYK